MDIWNTKHLKPPASSSCKLENQEINLHELNGLMRDAYMVFGSQIIFDAECKLLHHMVRVNKLRYRTTIGYKYLQKLNRCIRNFQEVDFKSLISWYMDFIPRQYEKDTYFPSRNILDYFLVRIQGTAKLLVRLLECCKPVYIHWIDKIKLAHGLTLAVIIIAIQARLFIICRYLLQCLCHLYDCLIALRNKVPNISKNWLSDNYKFPRDLRAWLDVDWAYKEEVFELKGHNRDLFSINIFDDEEDVEFTKEYRIVEGQEDLQIVSEYLSILDSDEEMRNKKVKVEEIDDDLQIINDEVRHVFIEKSKEAKLKTEKKQQVINLDEEIGEPLDDVDKIGEVTKIVETLNSLDALDDFIKDSNYTYFRNVDSKNHNSVIVEILKGKLEWAALKPKSKRKLLKTIRKSIIALIEEDEGSSSKKV